MNVVGRLAEQHPLISNVLCGSCGGVGGALLVNAMFPATGFPEVLWAFVLPGLVMGGMLGGLLGSHVGRPAVFIGAFFIGHISVLAALMMLLREG